MQSLKDKFFSRKKPANDVEKPSPGVAFSKVAGQTGIVIRDLVLKKPDDDGVNMLSLDECVIEPGTRMMFSGDSGSGKSSFLRVLHGLWNFGGEGSVTVPAEAKMMFIPQTDYFPDLTLKGIVCAPQKADSFSDEQVAKALSLVGLDDMVAEMNDESKTGDDWNTMSSGQKKRLAFASALLQKPDILKIDDASSALDKKSAQALYSTLYESLPHAIIISVSNDKELASLHNVFALVAKDGRVSCHDVHDKTGEAPAVSSVMQWVSKVSGTPQV